MITDAETSEAYFLRYYNQIPIGGRDNFMLVIKLVLGGSNVRWYKRFAAWKEDTSKRRLRPHEIDKLFELTIDENWRKILKTDPVCCHSTENRTKETIMT